MIFCSRWRQGKVQISPSMATSPQESVHLRGLMAAPSLPRDPSHRVVQMGMSYLPSTPGGTALFSWGGRGNRSGWAVAQEPRTTSPPTPRLFLHRHSLLEGRLRKVTFLFAFGFAFFFIFTVVFLPSLFKRRNNSHPTICSSITWVFRFSEFWKSLLQHYFHCSPFLVILFLPTVNFSSQILSCPVHHHTFIFRNAMNFPLCVALALFLRYWYSAFTVSILNNGAVWALVGYFFFFLIQSLFRRVLRFPELTFDFCDLFIKFTEMWLQKMTIRKFYFSNNIEFELQSYTLCNSKGEFWWMFCGHPMSNIC